MMLETNIVKEPMKCKHAYPEKFKEGGRVRIRAWLGVMENYLYVGNTSPNFWVDIAQIYLEVRVVQNWQNSMKILETKKILKSGYISKRHLQLARTKLSKLSQHSSV